VAARSCRVALQALEYFNLSFGAMTGGGFGSVFLGFTVVFGIFWLGAVYLDRDAVGAVAAPAVAAGEVAAPTRVLRPHADACATFLYVMP